MLISLRPVALFVYRSLKLLLPLNLTGYFRHENKSPHTGVALLYIDKSYRNFLQYHLIYLDDLFGTYNRR